jgi:hypothetical protein
MKISTDKRYHSLPKIYRMSMATNYPFLSKSKPSQNTNNKKTKPKLQAEKLPPNGTEEPKTFSQLKTKDTPRRTKEQSIKTEEPESQRYSLTAPIKTPSSACANR